MGKLEAVLEKKKNKKQLEHVEVGKPPIKPKSVMEEVIETVKEASVPIPALKKPLEPRRREEDE